MESQSSEEAVGLVMMRNEFMLPEAQIKATLGLAYEMRTANLIALAGSPEMAKSSRVQLLGLAVERLEGVIKPD